jgi:hypothetical protein
LPTPSSWYWKLPLNATDGFSSAFASDTMRCAASRCWPMARMSARATTADSSADAAGRLGTSSSVPASCSASLGGSDNTVRSAA